MRIAEKLTTVAENMPLVYAAGKAACAQKHFVTTVTGNGQESISVNVPFKPDVLLMFVSEVGMYGKLDSTKSFVSLIHFDISGFGMIGGRYECFIAGGVKQTAVTTTTMLTRYAMADDGMVTLQNFSTSGTTAIGTFLDGVEYVVIAAKYTDQTDRERITQYVQSLSPTGGSVTMNGAKKTAAFTDEEWNALIAQKPGWTFSFI